MTKTSQPSVPSEPDHPADILLYGTEQVRVVRRTQADGQPVVLKRAIGAVALRRLGHEAALLGRLAHVSGVPSPLDTPSADTLVLPDDGSTVLTDHLRERPLDVRQSVDYALGVARILAAVHQAGIVHKDIGPANLLIHPATLAPTLIDFNIAALAGAAAPAGTEGEIAGTWAYMSPEHTGRTGRAPDARSDLYSLGATLYHVITGRKPFETEDLLELVHAHLVQVPTAPAELAPGLPDVLSNIVMRLLAKEPEKRYQSAEGLAHDLQRVQRGLAGGTPAPFELGAFDFGAELKAPPGLLGREAETDHLRRALDALADGRTPWLRIVGEAATGKSALVEALRGLAAARRAWYVGGAFVPESADVPAHALAGFAALGRQLLALPADQLAQVRDKARGALEGSLGHGVAQLPEFQALLGEHPAAADGGAPADLTAEAAVRLLRALASAERPIVMVADDFHHAPALSHRLLAALQDEAAREPIPGLLLVGVGLPAARPAVDGSGAFAELTVGPLAPDAAARLVAGTLRMDADQARPLAASLERHTHHRPGRILALLNALRRDGLLTSGDGRWAWDAESVRRYVGVASPAELQARTTALPQAAGQLVGTLAAFGGEAAWDDLVAATGSSVDALRAEAAPAIDDGLISASAEGLALSHTRIAEPLLARLDEPQRTALHLALARKLSDAARPQPLVARQYFRAGAAALGSADAGERRQVSVLLENEAERLRTAGRIDEGKRYVSAAIGVLQTVATDADTPHLFDLHVRELQALFALGRHDEVDAAYAALEAGTQLPERLAPAVRCQIFSLMARRRMADAVGVGLALMARLGHPKPDDIRPDLAAGMKRLVMWHRGDERMKDHVRAEISDPRDVALALVVPETMTPAYFLDPTLWAWLAMLTHKLWVEIGPHPRILSSIASLPFTLVGAAQDFTGAHTVSRHLIEVGDSRGYVPGVGIARCIHSIASGHWKEPIEASIDIFHEARVMLLAHHEPFAAFTYVAADLALDCKPSLVLALPEVEGGLENAREQRNEDFLWRYQPRLQLIKALRGQTSATGAFSDGSFDEAEYVAKINPASPTAATYHHVATIRSMLFGDMEALAVHSAKSVSLADRTPGYYVATIARILRGVSAADQLRMTTDEAARAPLLEIVQTTLAWLAARAADAPVNFAHLHQWLDAERAWALESVWVAGAAFDRAVASTEGIARPWHRALIHERAALFSLAQGAEELAKPLMFTACEQYDAWGAAGKVKEMRRQHAFLRSGRGLSRGDTNKATSAVGSEALDLMAVLRASQALSSETVLSKLVDRVSTVLGTVTGATAVQLVVRQEDGEGTWVLAHTLDGAEPMTVEEAGASGEFPLSAFRYAERTRQLLLIEDIVRDERFSEDPFAQALEQCSMMFSPMLKQGNLHAMLVLENRQRRNAFSGDRLDSVAMIAGQLSVSLDNAMLYASLEKRVAERTAQLRQKTNDINTMLQNMPQGVLTIVAGGFVHPEYSAFLETILETADIAGASVMDLLFSGTSLGADMLSQVDAAIGSVIGEDEMNYGFNSHLLAGELDKTVSSGAVKSLALSWSPIVGDEGTVDKLMLCVRDVTELKRLEAEANSRKRELQVIGEILTVTQEKFHEFIDSARGFIAENKGLIERTAGKQLEVINLLFRNMHTIKGNARTYGLLGLTNQVHLTEQHYDDLRKDEDAVWDCGTLLAELAQVAELVEQYAHVNDVVLGRKGPGRRAAVEKFLMVERGTVADTLQVLMGVDYANADAMRLAVQHVGSTLHMMGTEPIGEILSGTIESLPSLAKELGKAAPQVHIEDHGIAVRSQASGLLKNLFTHLLRNSLDHGIETPAQRLEAGKPEAGRIALRLEVDDGKLYIRLSDDGRGLALGRIRQRALEQNLLVRGAGTSAEDVAQLIFRSGFSTAKEVTEVSGRGVGMDAVRAFLEKEGGSIAIRFLDDRHDADFRPFETVIALPDKLAASMHAAMSFSELCGRLGATKV